jgi:hypothetical protein
VRHCLHIRLSVGLALLLISIALVGCRGETVPPRPLPSRAVDTPPPAQKSLTVPGIPGLYLAWGSPVNAVPPTREPDDPLAPGNELVGIDCFAYLGSGGDVGITGVWDRRAAINWGPYDYCIKEAAQLRCPTAR